MYFYESNAATVQISIETEILYFFFKISMNQRWVKNHLSR
jgi:hypothetical protein